MREFFMQISDMFSGKRNPRIKLTEEGRKYYNECERLLNPFRLEHKEIYTKILSTLEKKIDLLDQVYNKADESLEIHKVARDFVENRNRNKYYAWALSNICYELKEIKNSPHGYLYEMNDRYKILCNNLYAKLEELEKN